MKGAPGRGANLRSTITTPPGRHWRPGNDQLKNVLRSEWRSRHCTVIRCIILILAKRTQFVLSGPRKASANLSEKALGRHDRVRFPVLGKDRADAAAPAGRTPDGALDGAPVVLPMRPMGPA